MNSCSDTTSSCGTASAEVELFSLAGSRAGGSEDMELTGEGFVLILSNEIFGLTSNGKDGAVALPGKASRLKGKMPLTMFYEVNASSRASLKRRDHYYFVTMLFGRLAMNSEQIRKYARESGFKTVLSIGQSHWVVCGRR